MLKSRKEGKYLVFEFEDGKNVKYDLSNGQTIGKLGKPVKDVCTQLRGYKILDVIDSFEDENYRRFLRFVDGRVNRSTAQRQRFYGRVEKVRNLGSFLNEIERYSRYEQIFSTGIKFIDDGLRYSIKEIPKGLIKLCKEHDLRLSNGLVATYIEMPNEINSLMGMEFNSISKKDILMVLQDSVIRNKTWLGESNIMLLIKEYHYKIQSLFTYFDNLITYEALEGLNNTINEFYDYVRMMSEISHKYEKYPKNLLTTHKIATRNYNRLKTKFEEEAFENAIDKSMEYSYGDYIFIYPETTQEIKNEAAQQNNCVASYIQRVIDGKCHILFMRKKDNKEKSLVTIEVRDNKIVQCKGKFNRDCTEKEMTAINKWNEARQRKINKTNKKEMAA